jgi:hypothetical protein
MNHPNTMADFDTPAIDWTLDHIRQHIEPSISEQGVPPVPLFNIDVTGASADRGVVRLFTAGCRITEEAHRQAGVATTCA